MERIFLAGTIITVDPARPRADAVAVSDGRIVAVGTVDDCRAALPGAEIVDTGAAALLPGFVEAHSHPISGGAMIMPPAYWIAPWFCPTWDDVVATFQRADAASEPAEPLAFSGFDALLHEHELPDAAELDEIFGDRVVVVLDNSGHAAVGTTALLRQLGWIDAPPADPVGGSFGRRADGSLDGRAREVPAIMQLGAPVLQHLASTGRPLQGAVEFSLLMASAGITATSEHSYRTALKPAYEALASMPHSPLRVALYHMSTEADAASPFSSPVPTERLRKVGIKLWADGSPWVGNIAQSAPYLDTPVTAAAGIVPGAHGIENMNYSRAQLDALLDAFAPEGWQMSVHVNGDLALDIVLDAFDDALARHELTDTDHRWRVEHLGGARADQFPSLAERGIVPSMGPFQFYYWGDLLDGGMFTHDVGAHWQRIGDATAAGLRVSYHNDGSVTPPTPLLNIQTAVTRRTRSGTVRGIEQAVTLDDALRAQTIDAAYALRMDDEIGSLEPGKLADFVMLDADPYAVDAADLGTIRVLDTWLGGERIDLAAFAAASGQVPADALAHLATYGAEIPTTPGS